MESEGGREGGVREGGVREGGVEGGEKGRRGERRGKRGGKEGGKEGGREERVIKGGTVYAPTHLPPPAFSCPSWLGFSWHSGLPPSSCHWPSPPSPPSPPSSLPSLPGCDSEECSPPPSSHAAQQPSSCALQADRQTDRQTDRDTHTQL